MDVAFLCISVHFKSIAVKISLLFNLMPSFMYVFILNDSFVSPGLDLEGLIDLLGTIISGKKKTKKVDGLLIFKKWYSFPSATLQYYFTLKLLQNYLNLWKERRLLERSRL